jgi:hypothetical protein
MMEKREIDTNAAQRKRDPSDFISVLMWVKRASAYWYSYTFLIGQGAHLLSQCGALAF